MGLVVIFGKELVVSLGLGLVVSLGMGLVVSLVPRLPIPSFVSLLWSTFVKETLGGFHM